MKAQILLLAVLLTGCNVDQPRALFQYCLQAAEPATAEAINACREAAWPEQRAKAPKEQA